MISKLKFFRRAALAGFCAFSLAGLQSAEPANLSETIAPISAPIAAVIDPVEAAGLIFERQQVMLQLEKDAEQLGLIVAGLAPKKKLAEMARAVANGAKDAEASFQTRIEGGRSKPEVWSNYSDYNQRMQAFVRKSDDMAKMAEAGNFNGVIESLNDALPCKACHDTYRAPKKPI